MNLCISLFFILDGTLASDLQHTSCEGVDSCSEDVAGSTVSLLQSSSPTVSLSQRSQPWNEHPYLVGVYHKAGSNVLRNVMRKVFDELGAPSSCRECNGGNSLLTTQGSSHVEGDAVVPNVCDQGYPSSIHWNNCNLGANHLIAFHNLAGPTRAVRIIRDPLEMVASAYCYHNAGNEMPGSPFAPRNIMELNATEGVPEVAPRMLMAIEPMVMTSRVALPSDTFTMKFEDVTRSSDDFDAAFSDAFDFLFGDSITAQEREEIEQLARTEDTNSEYFDSASGDEHVSSDECKDQARAALPLMDPTLYQTYQNWRVELGYD